MYYVVTEKVCIERKDCIEVERVFMCREIECVYVEI